MENELYHFGRKGMKWYQHIFTSGKKASGKKSRTDNADDSSETQSKPKHSAAYSSARKSVKEMDDSELNAAINRLRQEQTYNQLYNQLHPQTVSKGKQFISTVWEKSISPALLDAGKEVGKKYVSKTLSKVLGIDDKDSFAELKKEVDILELKKKKTLVEDFYANREKQAQKQAAKTKNNEAKTDKQAEKAKVKADNTTNKADETKTDKQAEKAAAKESKAQDKTEKETTKSESKTYSGTVEGTGTSKFTGWKSDKFSKEFDVDFSTATTSDIKSNPSTAIGERYVADLLGQSTYLLEDKNK